VKRPNRAFGAAASVSLWASSGSSMNRDNVTVDAASLCLKAGNASFSGRAEAISFQPDPRQILGEALQEALLPRRRIQVIPTQRGTRPDSSPAGKRRGCHHSARRRGLDPFCSQTTRGSRCSATTKGSATFTWMSRGPGMAAEICFNARCSGRLVQCDGNHAGPRRGCEAFLPAMLKRFRDPGWRSAAVRKPWPSCLRQPCGAFGLAYGVPGLILGGQVVRGLDEARITLKPTAQPHEKQSSRTAMTGQRFCRR